MKGAKPLISHEASDMADYLFGGNQPGTFKQIG
jgi:hypothetical protein